MAISNSFDILRAVIEATPDAIFVKNVEGRYVVVNQAAARFLGRSPEEVLGKHDLELYPEATARRFIDDDRLVLATGKAHEFEGVADSESGAHAHYLVTKGVYRDAEGKILGIYGISHDVTELRQARQTLEQTREALFHAQKMEAVGQLTGGIAHDFNNILSVIIGNLDLLRLVLKRAGTSQDPHAFDLIDAVLRASMQGKDLITQLLTFAGRRQLNPQPVNVNKLVQEIVLLINRTLGPAIHIAVEDDGRGGLALVDPSALEAAVLNIALNARDAMPEGGTLTLRTSRVDVATAPVTGGDPQQGSYTLLAVGDTGCGMTPETAARAFEPFFTTKGGHGTGLGLSMVYGFAKQSGGTVTIRSTPGRGTTVEMFLPLVEHASGASVSAQSAESSNA
jgi:PAS domain S-box-containing protein